jgi:hypothetical protein
MASWNFGGIEDVFCCSTGGFGPARVLFKIAREHGDAGTDFGRRKATIIFAADRGKLGADATDPAPARPASQRPRQALRPNRPGQPQDGPENADLLNALVPLRPRRGQLLLCRALRHYCVVQVRRTPRLAGGGTGGRPRCLSRAIANARLGLMTKRNYWREEEFPPGHAATQRLATLTSQPCDLRPWPHLTLRNSC